jgi:NTE family protein
LKFLIKFLLLLCAGIFFSGCKAIPASPEPAKSVMVQPAIMPSPAPTEIKSEIKPDPVIARKKNPPKIALALGGGAVRGFAHVGVIKTLEAQGINIDIVTGTSAGSIVGALYAGGTNAFDLQKIALAMDESVATDWTILPNRGVFKGESLQNYINQALSNRNIEKLNKVFGVVATDLQSGEMAVFRQGNTGMAVRASSSVPGLFQPMNIAGREYVDGGLTSPVPVRAAKLLGADIVIAVDISKPPESGKTGNGLDLLLQTFAIMGKSINYFELNEAQVVIRPNIGDMSPTDFKAKHLAILEGERAAQNALEKIRLTIERYYATP